MRKADFHQEEYWRNLIESSLSRLLILYILSEAPMHGYAIKKQVADFSRGLCTVSEGGLYPALARLASAGLLRLESQNVNGRKRKIYYITYKGREAFALGIRMWRQVVPLLEKIYRKEGGRRVKINFKF